MTSAWTSLICITLLFGNISDWEIDDILLQERASDFEIDPSGTFAIWVHTQVKKVDKEERIVTNLQRTWLETAKTDSLTHGTLRNSRPKIAADGERVYYLSNRPLPEPKPEDAAATQIWVLPLNGGDARPVTKFSRNIQDFAIRNTDELVVLAQAPESLWEKNRKTEKDKAIVVDDYDHTPYVRLYRYSLQDEKWDVLTSNLDWIDQMSVAPDGSFVVARAQRSLSFEFDGKVPPRILVINLTTGSEAALFEDGVLQPSNIKWAPDSSGFYFENQYSTHPLYRTATITQLHFCAVGSWQTQEVDLNWDRYLGGAYDPTANGVIALLANGVHLRPTRVNRTESGWANVEIQGVHSNSLDDWSLGPDGTTIVYQTSTPTVPYQWYRGRLDNDKLVEEKVITELNSGFAEKPKGRSEVMTWTGARGDEVEGLLHYPLHYEEGKRYPMVLQIHGGPAGTDRNSWRHRWASPVILFNQRGAFVLQVNYHGSAGYGLEWVESIGGGNYYELEGPDLLSGVDTVIERGLVDPDQLACAGWSNGGILTAELITRTDRFKAASIGAADVEWISDWANVDFGATFDNYYFGATPFENPQLYLDKSPFFRLPDVTTPTVIFTGTEDRAVPPHQSWSLFRALQQAEKTEARLVLFPGEPHGLRKFSHQRRKLLEELAWFDRFLFQKDKPAKGIFPVIAKDSPLFALQQRTQASRTGGHYGVDSGGVLVPETVEFEGWRLGRFEVTQQQYAAFDSSYVVTDPNKPLTGIEFASAQKYCNWLSATTGFTYRLPTQDEWKTLTKKAGTSGNTLNRWVGDSSNRDDTRAILQALSGMERTELLLHVGSMPGRGDNMVFDLDGNAAEWCVVDGAAGVPMGPAADLPSDTSLTQDLPSQLVGLRVIRDGGQE